MLRLTTLGATDLRDRHGHPIRDLLAQPKRVGLLVYLAVEGAKGPVSRDRLLGLFWPESDAARARNALSQALHTLRQSVGTDVIESQGATSVEIRSGQLWCDATAFQDAIDRGETDLALDLYRGEFCPTLFVSGTPEVDQWIDEQRRKLRRLALVSARSHAERQAGRGDLEGAARTARRAMAMHPDDEADVRAHLGILERSGDVAGALYAYEEYARRLRAELETDPGPETRRLVDAIRRRREASVAVAPGYSPPSEALGAGGPPTPTSPRQSRRWTGPALIAVAVLAVVVGSLILRSREQRYAPPSLKTLAVFPFAFRGGAALAYLGEGMLDLLSAKLDGAAGFHAVDPRSVAAAGGDPRVARGPDESARIARELGAGWYLTGEVVEIAGRLQLSGALYDVRGPSRPATRATVAGDTSALFDLVDDLTGQILAGLAGGRDTTLTRLAALTTHSLPALKAFLEGEQALRAGRDAQAAAAFLDAATLDTTFALAEYRLALSTTWASIPDVVDPATWAAIAARHAQRLTPLVRDLLAAYRAYKEVNAEDAERRYLGITRGYPDNVEAWFMLGETWFHYNSFRGRSLGESRPAFERVLALDPFNSHALIHLARLAAFDGRAADLDSLAHRYRERYSDADRIIEIEALQVFLRGDSAQWPRVGAAARRAGSLVSISVLQAAVFYAQNLDAAEVLAPPMAQGTPDSVGRRLMGRLYTDLPLARGRREHPRPRSTEGVIDEEWVLESEALLASDPFFLVDRSRVAAMRERIARRKPYPGLSPATYGASVPHLGGLMQTYLLGLLSVRLGDTAVAARHASELATVRDPKSAGYAEQLSHALRAELARSRGDAPGALAELDRFLFNLTGGSRSFGHWGARERFLRAEMLHVLGRDEDALGWYDSLQYELCYMAASHFRQGEIYRRQGNVERAQFHFGRFVTLWKDSAPEFRPMLGEARRALASLEEPGTP